MQEEERIRGAGLERREGSKGRMRRGDEDVGVERVGTCVCERGERGEGRGKRGIKTKAEED